MNGDKRPNPIFEQAVDCVIHGRSAELRSILNQRPELAQAASIYGHQATLLHYVAANGVETWRQVVPPNAAEIAQIMLNAGANVKAKAAVYDGQYDTISLLMTSAHPANMGVTDQIAAVLSGN
jgi:hypothetical protein